MIGYIKWWVKDKYLLYLFLSGKHWIYNEHEVLI